MRLITFLHDGRESVGALIDGDRQVVNLSGAGPAFASMLTLIEGGAETLARAQALVKSPPKASVLPAAQCKLLAPLPRPTQIRDCLTFPAHLKGGARVQAERMTASAPEPAKAMAELEAAGRLDVPKAFYDFPLYYISNRMSISGPDDDVEWPPYSQTIDYEMEWAAVIGTPCRGASKDNARQSIFGYTIFNDWSARDEQFRAMQAGAINLGPARGKDFCNGVGPCIVTADEIADPYRLDMIVRVNGEEVSRGNSSGMHFKFEDLIAFLSEGTTLYPGELICSGTVGGGCSFETGQTLKPNDVIELEVQNIGVLRNRVVASHIKAG
jgi:2-keto-4-pentenoate hydratase/2-oxohepta-3-ene-1,7-dioic acid hydratase in catechol pathway